MLLGLNHWSVLSHTCRSGTPALASGLRFANGEVFDIRPRSAGFRPTIHATLSGFSMAQAYASPAAVPVPSIAGFLEKPWSVMSW